MQFSGEVREEEYATKQTTCCQSRAAVACGALLGARTQNAVACFVVPPVGAKKLVKSFSNVYKGTVAREGPLWQTVAVS